MNTSRRVSYYDKAKQGSTDVNHPGMKILLDLSRKSNKIIDLGCGEGSRLKIIGKGKNDLYGVDTDPYAIKLAKRRIPDAKFFESDLSRLPFKDNEFDLVYSAYVLEHLKDTKKCILEAIRISKESLVFMCPNYGSPNRCSPNFVGSRFLKLVRGFVSDFRNEDIEKWHRVHPSSYNNKNYKMDDDTLIEPYILSLIIFLKSHNIRILKWDTCWEYELPDAKLHQKLFRLLAAFGIFPFKYWGPHIVVYGMKL